MKLELTALEVHLLAMAMCIMTDAGGVDAPSQQRREELATRLAHFEGHMMDKNVTRATLETVEEEQ